MSDFSGVLWKSWLEAMTFTPAACAPSMILVTIASPVKILYVNEIDIAGLSCLDVQLCVIFRLDGFLAASLEVRKVIRIGVSPRTARSSFKTSSTFSKSKTPSNQSTRHSTTSTGIESNVLASSMISCLVTPTIRNDDLRCAGADFDISNFDSIHNQRILSFYQ